ncbi:MAG: metal ABC transporter ATP-binding protein [bacterium]|nr:metal ABC transporter ATP-binding protein [bacterium]
MSKALVTFDHVVFSYGSENVVDDVLFSIKEDDFIGLIGQNGSGKTTLLKLMIGLLEPSSGRISRLTKHLVGYVPQKSSQTEQQFPITCEEIVLQGRVVQRGLFRMLTSHDRKKAQEALDAVGLLDRKDALLRELSGGQQQRVFIARALASEPKLLILDEPTVGVDEASQEEFYMLLALLRREKKLAIVIVSHDVEVVVREVNSLLCMNRKLVYHGNPEQFVEGNYAQQMYGKGRKFIHHNH